MTPVRVRALSKKERNRRNRIGKNCRACGNKYDEIGDCLICVHKAKEKAHKRYSDTLMPHQQMMILKGQDFVATMNEPQLKLFRRYESILRYTWGHPMTFPAMRDISLENIRRI